jgi:Putative zincin peptidase
MKTPKPEDLHNETQFKKLITLQYDDIISFVFRNIKKPTPAVYFYFISNALLLLSFLYLLISGFGETFVSIVKQLVVGILVGSFLVIPVHETVHGIAYKLIGAPKIHFGADLKQMIFYVAADKYPVGRKGFYFIALAPFFFINLASIALLIFPEISLLPFTVSFLLFHNIMCIGDFAMVSYFQQKKDKELYTYDDHKKKVSYIFERI